MPAKIKEQVNYFDYGYKEEDTVEINGQIFKTLMDFLKQLEQKESMICYPHSYTDKATEVKKDGLVIGVDVETKEYPSLTSFMSQRPVKASSITGYMAMEFLSTLTSIHAKNIESGKAIKLGGFEKLS